MTASRRSEITRRQLLRGVGALGATAAGAALLGACAQPGAGPAPAGTAAGTGAAVAPRRGGTLAVALAAEPGPIVPYTAANLYAYMIQAQVMDGLIIFDPATKQIKPALAESWDVSPDGKAYTMKLRKGVKFHDGTEFTSEAVALNFERVRDQNAKHYDKTSAAVANVFLSSADKVEVVDQYTARYVLKQPNGDFLALNPRTYMANPTLIKSMTPEQLSTKPSGTGPFKFVERQENRIVFDRYDGYWQGAPYVDRLVMRVYPDIAGAAAALEAGEIDVAVDLPISTAVRLQDKFKVFKWSSQFTFLFNFNMRHAATKDVRVRQALNYAVDREKLARDLYKGQVTVARGVASPTFPSWSDSVQPYPFDPAKAKQLLAEAGFASGLTIKALQVSGLTQYPLLPELCQSVQSDLRNVGVTLTYDVQDNQAFNRTIANGVPNDYAFFTYALGGITPSNLELVYGKRFQPPNGVNRNYYESAEAEKLFDQARGEVDQTKRNQLYTQADKILRDDAVALFTVIYGTQAVHSPKVNGILDRLAWLDFSKTWLAQ